MAIWYRLTNFVSTTALGSGLQVSSLVSLSVSDWKPIVAYRQGHSGGGGDAQRRDGNRLREKLSQGGSSKSAVGANEVYNGTVSAPK